MEDSTLHGHTGNPSAQTDPGRSQPGSLRVAASPRIQRWVGLVCATAAVPTGGHLAPSGNSQSVWGLTGVIASPPIDSSLPRNPCHTATSPLPRTAVLLPQKRGSCAFRSVRSHATEFAPCPLTQFSYSPEAWAALLRTPADRSE